MAAVSDELDERGYFWWSEEGIPSGSFAPVAGSYGRLMVTDAGYISLELDGTLDPGRNPMTALLERGLKVGRQISGKLRSSNRSVLLGNVWGNGGRMSTNGLSHENYLAESCLVSPTAFDKPTENPNFRRMTISLIGFEEWLRLGSIKTDRTNTSITVTHDTPRECRYALDDGELRIVFDLVGPLWGESRSDKLNLTEVAFFIYEFVQPMTLATIIERYRRLEDLLVLLTNVERSFAWPNLRKETDQSDVTFYFIRDKRLSNEIFLHECWTSLPGLKDHLVGILAKWARKRDSIGPGFYLYLANRRGVSLAVENQFNNLAFGLESFHRSLNPPSEERALQAKTDGLVGQISSDKDRKWLRNRLKVVGGPNLQQRIYEMLKPLPLGLDKRRLRAFADRCARFRKISLTTARSGPKVATAIT